MFGHGAEAKDCLSWDDDGHDNTHTHNTHADDHRLRRLKLRPVSQEMKG